MFRYYQLQLSYYLRLILAAMYPTLLDSATYRLVLSLVFDN